MSERCSILETSPWLIPSTSASRSCVICCALREWHRREALLEALLDLPLPRGRHRVEQFTKVVCGPGHRYSMPYTEYSPPKLSGVGGLARRPVLLRDFDHDNSVRGDFGRVLIGGLTQVGVLPKVAHFVRALDADVAPLGGDLGGVAAAAWPRLRPCLPAQCERPVCRACPDRWRPLLCS